MRPPDGGRWLPNCQGSAVEPSAPAVNTERKEPMKAAVYRGPGQLVVEDVPEPVCDAAGAVVEVEACAICGTDRKVVTVGNPKFKPPQVLGHEFVGRIVEVGRAADGAKVGERVTMATTIGCLQCRYCRSGRTNLCAAPTPISSHYPGAFARYVAIPPKGVAGGFLIPCPADVAAPAACLTEPLSCVLNGQQIAGVAFGKSVVIIGSGPIGCLHVYAARAAGATEVYLTGTNAWRNARAREMPVDEVIDARAEDWMARVTALTRDGADICIVTASRPEPQVQALEVVRKGGTVNLFASLPSETAMLTLNSRTIHYREISVTGVSDSTAEHARLAMKMIAAGRVDARRLVTHELPLDRIAEGIELMKSGECLKVVVFP